MDTRVKDTTRDERDIATADEDRLDVYPEWLANDMDIQEHSECLSKLLKFFRENPNGIKNYVDTVHQHNLRTAYERVDDMRLVRDFIMTKEEYDNMAKK